MLPSKTLPLITTALLLCASPALSADATKATKPAQENPAQAQQTPPQTQTTPQVQAAPQVQPPAQQQEEAPPQADTTLPLPPPSNLGVNVTEEAPPQVIYPATPEVVEGVIRDIEDLQLTPEQIERLKRIYLQRERQKAMPYVSPAKPITRTIFINLDPGVSPPTLRLQRGQQTSLVFSDMSGQPWLIQHVSMNRNLFSDGRAGAGNAQQPPTNILPIEPLAPAAYGNVTITLRGLSTPVIFVLTSAQAEVDMRLDLKVPGNNPDAVIQSVQTAHMPNLDGDMGYFLDGVPPRDAKRLNVSGLEGTEAWSFKNQLYVRSSANAQYPAYTAAARSTSGMSVYRFAQQHSSITFTTGGQAITVFIEQNGASK